MSTYTRAEQQSDPQKSASSSNSTNGTSPKSKSDWNILFYIIGDGIISSSMVSQLKAIEDAGFEEDTNVLVYFDPNVNGKNARIFDVNVRQKEGYTSKETFKKTIIGDGRSSFVRDIAEDCHIPCLPQMPAEITLRYFLEYAKSYYPAKNYMLFLMGHGVIVGNDAFLPDPDDNSAITLADLGWILQRFAAKVRDDGDEFHLIGFHSCSMSSVELLYELAGSARYMIGTQGSAFPGSWPYRQILKRIFIAIDEPKPPKKGSPEQRRQASTINAEENCTSEQGPVNTINADEIGAAQQMLIKPMLEALQDYSFYNAEDFWLAGFSADIALCRLDTDKVNTLKQPIEELSQALQKGLEDPAATNCIQLAHLESQSYWEENYTDLFDFCSCLWERCLGGNDIQAAIQKACKKVTWAINGQMPRVNGAVSTGNGKPFNQLVVYSDYYGPAYQFSNGLSIYFPWRSPANKVIQNYRGYKFTREHGSKSWWSFLYQYFNVTQRPARSIRTPWQSVPEVPNSIPWRSEINLLRTLSDERLLSLGPPPAKVSSNLARIGSNLSDKLSEDPSKVGGELSKVGRNLSNVGNDLSKVGGDLLNVGGDLSDNVGSDLSRVDGEVATKIGFALAKAECDLAKILGDMSKVGGDLSKVGGDLSKVGGDLEGKVGGDLSKVGGDLSKVGGDLSKVGGDLSKVGGDLGGLYGHTVVKNFASPENQFVTSRGDVVENNKSKERPRRYPAPRREQRAFCK